MNPHRYLFSTAATPSPEPRGSPQDTIRPPAAYYAADDGAPIDGSPPISASPCMSDTPLSPVVVMETPAVGPLYMSGPAFTACQLWSASHDPTHSGRILALVGPPKSGRSLALTHVLPGLLAAAAQEQRGGGPLQPTVVYVSCASAGATAAGLAHAILDASTKAVRAVRRISRISPPPALVEDCLRSYASMLQSLTRRAAASGAAVALLLDDVEVRGRMGARKGCPAAGRRRGAGEDGGGEGWPCCWTTSRCGGGWTTSRCACVRVRASVEVVHPRGSCMRHALPSPPCRLLRLQFQTLLSEPGFWRWRPEAWLRCGGREVAPR